MLKSHALEVNEQNKFADRSALLYLKFNGGNETVIVLLKPLNWVFKRS